MAAINTNKILYMRLFQQEESAHVVPGLSAGHLHTEYIWFL